MQSLDGRFHKPNPIFKHGADRLAAFTAAISLILPAASLLASDAATNSPSDTVSAPTDPVLNLLLEKGMITEDEAAKTQAQADALRTNMAAQFAAGNNQWKITKSIKNLGLYGDVRLRYEDREEATPSMGTYKGKIDLYRFRYAVRLGLRGEALDDFYYGVRLETSANPRSTWVTLGTSSPDPYGKSAGNFEIGQAYLGWHPEPWFDFTLGKMPNPLYTSSMVWSPSINPEGLAEHLKYTVGDIDFFANFAQFLYQDENPLNATPNLGFGTFGQSADNIFQVAWQGGLNYRITPDISAKVGATIYQYFGLKQTSANNGGLSPFFGDPYIGEGAYAGLGSPNPYFGASGFGTSGSTIGNESLNYPNNQVGLDHLLVLEVPFELNWQFRDLNFRAFGDFAYNLDGRARAIAAADGYDSYLANQTPTPATIKGFAPQTSDVKAYQFGLAVGSKDRLGMVCGTTIKKHAWEVRSYWQHVEQYSLDPNLLDLDFNAGAENLEGIYAALAYGFSDNVMATVRYGHARRINNSLGTGGTGTDIPQINPIKSYDLLQVDMTFMF